MKYSLRFLLLAVLLSALTLFQAGDHFTGRYAEVSAFRGAALEQDVFDPLIAKSINEAGSVKFTLDGEETTRFSNHIYVDPHMRLMGDSDFLEEVFSCSAHTYGGDTVKIERGDASYELKVGLLDGEKGDDDRITLSEAPVLQGGRVFVPIADVAGFFGYTYDWDNDKLALSIASDRAEPARLPSRYDLREEERAPQIRNQGNESTCWAYAAVGAVESSLLPEQEATLSPEDVIENKGYSFRDSTGGDFSQALAYMTAWKGPVYEKGGRVALHLQEAHVFDSDNIDEIKWAVYQHGGVSSSIYADISGGSLQQSAYYNGNRNAYCYNGSETPNHDIVIIGWDDDFATKNFRGKANGKGAFVCQNSWGASFGDGGVFYVSYYDTNIGKQAVAYTGLDSADNYDAIYQSDLCGWTGQVGYRSENVLGANIYTASGEQDIKAAGFYALGRNSFYELYMVPDYRNTASLAKRTLVASGSLKDKGYYTIPFTNPVRVEGGKRFAVILSITTPGTDQPMAIEYNSARMKGKVDVTDGESYISGNGLEWDSVEETSGGNLCLKAYGDKAAAETNER